ncbi:MAG TPA: response regulator transcription factor [Candidatus Hydrogenedentes bacterium]|nr:response regulator transcription factor [Candidatus Hydrogenedentota bacterium]HQH53464.1 response regulator transcription factor [Candidatus Hydrogenedentota bacterium]
MPERTRIVLADDHDATLERVRLLLCDRFDVVAAVHDGLSLLDAVTRLKPDLAVIDIAMPGLTGLEVTSELKRRRCPTLILILTVSDDPDVVREAFALGVSGYVVKAFMVLELVTAIDQILRGQPFVSPGVCHEA